MEIFQPSIIHNDPSTFNTEVHDQIHQLGLSTDLSSILQTIKDVNQGVWYIYGEPGSGCTTLVQGLCQHLCQSNTITDSDILYLSLNQSCNKELFCDFIVSKHNKLSVKMSELKEENFKVICIDNADLCGNFIDVFLADVLKACKLRCFVVFNQTKQHGPHSSDFASAITVHGLSHSAGKVLVSKELQPLSLPDDEISKLCDLVNANPAAIKLVCGLLNGQPENISSVLQDFSTASNLQSSCSMDIILQLISKFLKESNIGVLYSLCSLRQPLPMLDVPPAIKELLHMKLLTVKQEGDVQYIAVHPSLKKYLLNKKNFVCPMDVKKNDCLRDWLSLVSNKKLCDLIKEAEENAWPFVPESWQFVDDVGEKESFNVKEHILSKNANIPSLTEQQILYECLYHAYIQNEFKKLAAVTFVLDRFLFWHGDKKTSMAVLEYIQKCSPETAIAPQLLVRRARLMKNEGNLRGAVEVLNAVTKEKDKVGNWKYKDDNQSQLTEAACIQLNGEVQYSLGNWNDSADLLLQSIELFATLKPPDKKGLSLGYGLLCPCLQNMTTQDYRRLAHKFGLVQLHPLLAAYISAQEAARSSMYTPMFYVRHICHAGEVLLQFTKLSTLTEEKQKLLRVAIEDLKDSIQAHQTYKSLTSREQFYILVLASFKLSIALLELKSEDDQKVGQRLKDIAMKLYEHYCSSSEYVPVDDHITELIDQVFDLLGLEKYHTENLPNPGQVLLEYYKQRSDQRLKENTRLTMEGLFVNSKIPLSPVSPEGHIKSVDDRFLISSAGVKQKHRPGANADKVSDPGKPEAHLANKPEGGQTVDRDAETVEEEEGKEGAHLVNKPEGGETVDRDAETVEEEEGKEGAHLVNKPESGETVDRDDATVEEEEGKEGAHLVNKPEGGQTVDRDAETVEEEEGKEGAHLVNKPEGGQTVDRDAETVEEKEGKEGAHLVNKPESGQTVDRDAETVEEEEGKEGAHLVNKPEGGQTVDRNAATAEEEEGNERALSVKIFKKTEHGQTVDRNDETEEEESRHKTVDDYAYMMSRSVEDDSGIIKQSLEDEAVSLPSQTQLHMHFGEHSTKENQLKTKSARDGILWKYDFASKQWRNSPTMVYIGDPLVLKKGMEGAQRDVFDVEFINQDEPLQKYVAKRYRKKIHHQQYENDVLSQMTARHYVVMFNDKLSKAAAGVTVGEIQFLPVVLLQLVDSSGHVTQVFNAEPYMSGEFTKLTNNTDWKNEKRRTDLVLAYSHFTYQESNENLIIVDIQGWAPLRHNKGCTYLTDPQIHSLVYRCFGTGNLTQTGFQKFWEMHSECNEICKMLKLPRPSDIHN